MHTQILRRIAKLPVIREVLGATAGGAVALSLYAAFEFARDLIGGGIGEAVGTRLHGAAGLVMAQGTVGLGLASTLALAGACAFMHRRMMANVAA